MRRHIPVAFVVSLLTIVALAAPASASHSWSTYHWARTANPFALSLGDNVDAGWDSYLRTSSSQWTTSAVLYTAVVTGSTTGRRCRAVAGRVEVCSAAYGQNGWLGLASISLSGGHINSGTVKVNDTYFVMPQYNNAAERAHVMCQEIGHTFGLGHTSEDGSVQNTCMDYSQAPTSTAPNQHDYDQLAAIYAHLDATSTVGSAAGSTVPATVGNDRSSWGQEVDRSADGKHATYVRDFDNGQRVITEVTWAR